MLGTRNTLYGLKVASLVPMSGLRRLFGAQLLIDESTAMALKPKDSRDAPLGYYATGLSVFLLWNLATLIGAVAGNTLGDPQTYGLDAAVPAAFLALLWPRLTTGLTRLTALGGAVLALGLVTVTQPGFPIIASALVAVLAAFYSPRSPESGPERPARVGR
jgi:predicted branched-subunit amino acid permease